MKWKQCLIVFELSLFFIFFQNNYQTVAAVVVVCIGSTFVDSSVRGGPSIRWPGVPNYWKHTPTPSPPLTTSDPRLDSGSVWFLQRYDLNSRAQTLFQQSDCRWKQCLIDFEFSFFFISFCNNYQPVVAVVVVCIGTTFVDSWCERRSIC